MTYTVSIGPVEVPLFIIIVFCAGMAFSLIAVFLSRANKKKLLEGRTDDPKILLKGLEVQTVDGKSIKTFHQGRYVAIVLEPGEHALVVVGSEVEYHGLRGRSSTTKTTSPTKLTITVEAHKTYELTFDFDSGFNLNAIN